MYITNVSVKVINDHSQLSFPIFEECQIAIVLFTNVVFSRIMELIIEINTFNSVNASEPAIPQASTDNLQAPLNAG